MPIYSLLSKELLNIWLSNLKIKFKKVYDTQDTDLLEFCMLNLYEYLQCYCKLEFMGVSELENIKVTSDDIKDKVNDDSLRHLINHFRTTRNNIGHGDNYNLRDIKKIMTNPKFICLLSEAGLPTDFIQLINSIINTIFNKDLYDSCYNDWVALQNKYRGIKLNIGRMLTMLESKYPKSIVKETLISLISTQVFV